MRRSLAVLLILCGVSSASVATAGGVNVIYIYTDAQGSPVAEADGSGNITATFDYSPFGSTLLGTQQNGPGFTGHVADPDTSLTYMQARYYDPSMGQFLSVDPAMLSAGRISSFNAYAYADNNPTTRIDPDGRATTCANGICTMTADTFNPKQSNGQTAVPSPQVKEGADAGKNMVAVHSGTQEKLGFVVQASDGSVKVQNASDTKTATTDTAQTASATIPKDAVAVIHGHIDSGPNRTNGMVDDPKSNGGYGDTQGLAAGLPEATVSNGKIGWHQIDNGQLQFSYPSGALNSSQNAQMQKNLNREQTLFQANQP